MAEKSPRNNRHRAVTPAFPPLVMERGNNGHAIKVMTSEADFCLIGHALPSWHQRPRSAVSPGDRYFGQYNTPSHLVMGASAVFLKEPHNCYEYPVQGHAYDGNLDRHLAQVWNETRTITRLRPARASLRIAGAASARPPVSALAISALAISGLALAALTIAALAITGLATSGVGYRRLRDPRLPGAASLAISPPLSARPGLEGHARPRLLVHDGLRMIPALGGGRQP